MVMIATMLAADWKAESRTASVVEPHFMSQLEMVATLPIALTEPFSCFFNMAQVSLEEYLHIVAVPHRFIHASVVTPFIVLLKVAWMQASCLSGQWTFLHLVSPAAVFAQSSHWISAAEKERQCPHCLLPILFCYNVRVAWVHLLASLTYSSLFPSLNGKMYNVHWLLRINSSFITKSLQWSFVIFHPYDILN